MKKVKYFLNPVVIVFLCWGNITQAAEEIDLLNLSAYPEGYPLPNGENVVVYVDEATGEKWLTNTP